MFVHHDALAQKKLLKRVGKEKAKRVIPMGIQECDHSQSKGQGIKHANASTGHSETCML